MKATLHSLILILLTLFLFTGCKDEDTSLRKGTRLIIRFSEQTLTRTMGEKTIFVPGDVFEYALTKPDGSLIKKGTATYNGEELITDNPLYIREPANLIVKYTETETTIGYQATTLVSWEKSIVTLLFLPHTETVKIEVLVYGYTPEELQNAHATVQITKQDVSGSATGIGRRHTLYSLVTNSLANITPIFSIHSNSINGTLRPEAGLVYEKGKVYTYCFNVPANEPLPVWSAASFDNVRKNLRGHYLQICDIDLSVCAGWKPIGSEKDFPFSGSYDGGGYRIRNLNILTDHSRRATGLFEVNEGDLSNIHILEGSINTFNETGAICGQNFGTISGCCNEIDINNKSYYNTGGICGYNNGIIENCLNKGKIEGGNGITGENTGTIQNCINEGNITEGAGICIDNSHRIEYCINKSDITEGAGITIQNNSYIYGCSNSGKIINSTGHTGGICKYNYAHIVGCNNTGTIIGKENSTGGICGFNKGAAIACYNTGKIQGNNQTGGICGSNLPYAYLYACYNTGNITGTGSDIAAICGANAGEKTAIYNCYYTGDVSDKHALKFSETDWPTQEIPGWGNIAPEIWEDYKSGEWICPWQDDLGSWNEGINPRYPKLRWEK